MVVEMMMSKECPAPTTIDSECESRQKIGHNPEWFTTLQ